jgi:hypothetical protein
LRFGKTKNVHCFVEAQTLCSGKTNLKVLVKNPIVGTKEV